VIVGVQQFYGSSVLTMSILVAAGMVRYRRSRRSRGFHPRISLTHSQRLSEGVG
jgi:hypothetical protein